MSTSTSHSSASLQIPTEILEQIIKEYWASPLSSSERVSFMCNSMRINSTWMTLYLRASCTDIHIPDSRYCLRLIQILCRESFIYKKFAPGLHNLLCRSITFRRDYESGPVDKSVYAFTQFLSKTFQGMNRLPYLRRISFELVDQTLNAVFPLNNTLPIHFPSHVTTLEMLFYYTSPILENPDAVKEVMYSLDHSGLLVGSLPFINKLCVYGASAGAMWDLAHACTHLRLCDSDVSAAELSRRLKAGAKLQRERVEKAAAQAAFDEEVNMRIEAQRFVDIGTDEDMLEAVGVHHTEELPLILMDLQSELAKVLEKERQGHVDVLKRKFLLKGIRVCEKFIRIVEGIEETGLEIDTSSSVGDHPRPVKHDSEISPLTKPNTSHVSASSRSHFRSRRSRHQPHVNYNYSFQPQLSTSVSSCDGNSVQSHRACHSKSPLEAFQNKASVAVAPANIRDIHAEKQILRGSLTVHEHASQCDGCLESDATSNSGSSATVREEPESSNSGFNTPLPSSEQSNGGADNEGEENDDDYMTAEDGSDADVITLANEKFSRSPKSSAGRSWLRKTAIKVMYKVGIKSSREHRDTQV